MVKLLYVPLFILCVLLSGCNTPQSEACERFPDVCEELGKHSEISAIITMTLQSDKAKLKKWLEDNDIEGLLEYEATDQMLVKIDNTDFAALSLRDDIEQIQKDKFYPR